MSRAVLAATWVMAYESLRKYSPLLKDKPGDELLVDAIAMIEGDPNLKSVGYGGLPNRDGIVELDAAFMDGQTLDCGMVAGTRKLLHPVKLARILAKERLNCFLCGQGADDYGESLGLETGDLLTENSKKRYEQMANNDKAYDGHDTVGMICLDQDDRIYAATSTSGLFMKRPGRVGDSPLIGSGYYADHRFGACVATGLGEEIMKGCLSYACVNHMANGLSAELACEKALRDFAQGIGRPLGAISLLAVDKEGSFGVATNVDFSFVIGTAEKVTVYQAFEQDGKTVVKKADQAFIDDYYSRAKA